MSGPTYALANDPSRCHLFAYGDDADGGEPFAIAQTAYDPEDPLMIESVFVLLQNGVWLNQLALSKLPTEKRIQMFFADAAEAIAAIERLVPPAEFERYEMTEAELRQCVSVWAGGGFLRRSHELVEACRASKRP